MTRLAVSIMVQNLAAALADAARAKEGGADLVEFRIDQFTDQPEQVISLVEQSALPCILTCRSAAEGGYYDGDDQNRVSLLEYVCLNAARPPAYIDLELEIYQRSANLRQKVGLIVDHPGQVRSVDTGLILSSHDFEQRPRDLLQRLEAMAAAPACRVMKLAWPARTIRDNLEAFEILLQRPKPAVVLCMGEPGLASRVLAKKFGGLLTFAALQSGKATAPGQPTLADLKTLYRWDAIGARTRVYGVIGNPVGHSMSPAIHNAGFDALGFDGVYLPMPVSPSYEAFKATVSSWLALEPLHFRGASVTIPHKENLLRFVEEQGGRIDPLAKQIGAANTLVVRDNGSLLAGNSDYAGALDAVCAGIGVTRADLSGFRVAVIGAGGAARAVVAGFAHYGATVVIYNRTLARAEELAGEFAAAPGKVVAARLEKLCDSCCQVFINCTPLGMSPNIDTTPIPSAADTRGWGPGTVVFDTVYNPVRTRLLREAHAAGCLTIPGTEMFVRQAAAQFEQWTGAAAPVDVFRKVLLDRLGQ